MKGKGKPGLLGVLCGREGVCHSTDQVVIQKGVNP